MTKPMYGRAVTAEQTVNTIAFWQFTTFIMLILLIWASEILNLPAIFFKLSEEELFRPNHYRACVMTAGVILTAIVTIGHTYLQHRVMLAGLLTVCASCRKVRNPEEQWETLESYVGRQSRLSISHGLCPDCYMAEIRKVDEVLGRDPRSAAGGDPQVRD